MTHPYKNYRCETPIPEQWRGMSYHYGYCQRAKTHTGPHRSRYREWEDGDIESHLRKDKEEE